MTQNKRRAVMQSAAAMTVGAVAACAAPGRANAVKTPFTVNATFPMCAYPLYPRYKGTGDPKVAGNYACTRE